MSNKRISRANRVCLQINAFVNQLAHRQKSTFTPGQYVCGLSKSSRYAPTTCPFFLFPPPLLFVCLLYFLPSRNLLFRGVGVLFCRNKKGESRAAIMKKLRIKVVEFDGRTWLEVTWIYVTKMHLLTLGSDFSCTCNHFKVAFLHRNRLVSSVWSASVSSRVRRKSPLLYTIFFKYNFFFVTSQL